MFLFLPPTDALQQPHKHVKKDFCIYIICKIKLRWVADLSINSGAINHLVENMRT